MSKTIICLIGIMICLEMKGQDTVVRHYWSGGTAYTIPEKRWELALFTSSHYGLSRNLELSAHPLLFMVLPHAVLKIGWGERAGFRLATEHGIFYPTLFMQLVSAKGTGGLISPEFSIPQMFAVSNRVLASFSPFHQSLLTAHAGITFSVKFGPLDDRTTIDLPLIYPRLAVFYNQPEIDAGIDFRGQFIQRLGWLVNMQNFMVCGTKQNYFMENKGVLVYTSKNAFLRIEAGYKLCFGKYPAGPQWHFLPCADIAFAIGK